MRRRARSSPRTLQSRASALNSCPLSQCDDCIRTLVSVVFQGIWLTPHAMMQKYRRHALCAQCDRIMKDTVAVQRLGSWPPAGYLKCSLQCACPDKVLCVSSDLSLCRMCAGQQGAPCLPGSSAARPAWAGYRCISGRLTCQRRPIRSWTPSSAKLTGYNAHPLLPDWLPSAVHACSSRHTIHSAYPVTICEQEVRLLCLTICMQILQQRCLAAKPCRSSLYQAPYLRWHLCSW